MSDFGNEADGNQADGNEADFDDEPDGNRVEGGRARAVLHYLATSIVDEPDSVHIEAEERRNGSVDLQLHVAPGDMGRVIGRRGRVAQSIRTIVRAAAASEGGDASVDIVD
ncbi:MAG: domain binding protein YlqC [Acidimicrobiales bacterium]|jgi:predicted RNA-binding protein YlqC (UPF0109 family)|nr:domain binding protein YlqC [Acidimicrobiales bacterium]